MWHAMDRRVVRLCQAIEGEGPPEAPQRARAACLERHVILDGPVYQATTQAY